MAKGGSRGCAAAWVLVAAACRGSSAAPLPPPPEPIAAPSAAVEESAAPPAACVLPAGGPTAYAGMTAERAVTALGAGSCATSSCHGGPRSGIRDVQTFAATIWAEQDRHARAYEVLHTPRSQRMADLLDIGPAHRAQQCLVCHSVQDAAVERLPAAVLADGVGCAACHGDAGGWKDLHTQPVWKELPPEARARLGYRELSTPRARVETCVRCHVGDRGHEVNHDMIAAGHPRLCFEFAAYQRLEPRHWSPLGRTESTADFSARSWAVGQAVALEAAANLLVVRAEQAAADAAGGRPVRWPDFAEFDCFSCHRGLTRDSTVAADGPAASRDGRPTWQPWSTAAARLLRAGLEEPPHAGPTAFSRLERSAVEIRRLLAGDWADGGRQRLGRIVVEARGLAVAAREGTDAIDGRTTLRVALGRHEIETLAAAAPADWQTWDAAAQTYLALEAAAFGGSAVTRGRWPSTQPEARIGAASRRSLDAIREGLRFPVGLDSPGTFDPRDFHRTLREVP